MRLFAGIKAFFNRQQIRSKIIAVYAPLILVPLLLLGYVSNTVYTATIIRKTINNVSDNLELIVAGINKILLNAENCSNILTLDLNKSGITEIENSNGLMTDLVRYREINNRLSLGLLIFPEVESATYIDAENKKVYSSDSKLEEAFGNKLPNDIIDRLDRESSYENIWFPMQRRNLRYDDEGSAFLPLARTVNNIRTLEKAGYLLLYIREDEISSLFTDIGPTKTGKYFIIDENATVISSRNKEELLKHVPGISGSVVSGDGGDSAGIHKIDGKSYLILSKSFVKTGWKLVCEIPMDELMVENRKISMLIALVALFCLAIALLGSTLLSNIISKPVASLAKHMLKNRDGIPDIYDGPQTSAETSRLADAFNTMIKRNMALVARVEKEEKKKREFELALIQLQIKPHFLYNTLDVISALAELGRDDEVITASRALADFYRAVLSRGKEIIRIGEEIENVVNYLYIQHIRYADVFDYEIRVDDEIRDYAILKLTLQPLVENAIYHGLKPKGGPGRIIIEGHMEKNAGEEDKVVITVSDDGVGIPDEKVAYFMKKNSGEKTRLSFGIYNVDERIKLFFGNEYGLVLESKAGAGTAVRIEIPARSLGKDYNESGQE